MSFLKSCFFKKTVKTEIHENSVTELRNHGAQPATQSIHRISLWDSREKQLLEDTSRCQTDPRTQRK